MAAGTSKNAVVGLMRKAAWRKHSLALQLATAKILALTNALVRKERELHEVRRRKESLDKERADLLASLRRVNEEHEQAQERERNLQAECGAIKDDIAGLRQDQYTPARTEVEALRDELPAPVQLPPDLQSQIDALLASLSPPPSDGGPREENGRDSKPEDPPATRAGTPESRHQPSPPPDSRG